MPKIRVLCKTGTDDKLHVGNYKLIVSNVADIDTYPFFHISNILTASPYLYVFINIYHTILVAIKITGMKHSLIILSAIIIMASCTKNNNQTWAERKAVGEYTFEKVILENENGFKIDNVTQQYNNMVLQLNDKKEAALIDRNHSITYFGKYEIVEEYVNNDDDDDNSSDYTIIIDIKSPGRGEATFHWVGEDASFGNKLRFRARKAEGRYRFRLNKI